MAENQNWFGNVGLQRVEMKNLEPYLKGVFVVGVIIGKRRPRLVGVRQGDEGAVTKAVWNFTIRESLHHYINVNYWESPDQVFQANDKFNTGDVVEIINPQIQIRKSDDESEKYEPMVTSPYRLSLNERSAITHHGDFESYQTLLRFPTKPTAMFVPIHDIHSSGGSVQMADVLAAVKGLNPVRTITIKSNETAQVRDIEIFDHTAPQLKVTLWEPDLINRSNSWKPRLTILFLTDLKISWSNFHRSFIATTSSRTIVTENPVGKEAAALHTYALNAPIATFDIVERMIASLPTSSDDVVSVRQLHERINRYQQQSSFSVLLYAFVSDLDLDGFSPVLLVKCGHCKMRIQTSSCENPECPVVFENLVVEPEVTFDVQVTLSDHTGSLVNCKLRGLVAETTLRCTAKEFRAMSDDEKGYLKWAYLFEQCKVHVGVVPGVSYNPLVMILKIEKADPVEVAQNIPLY